MQHDTEALFKDIAISLVLPAFNEQDCIVVGLREADAVLRKLVSEYEIIVVNDGSKDETAEKVRIEMLNTTSIRLIEHKTNLGYGAALRSGFNAAQFPLVSFTDADSQFDLIELSHLIPLTESYDLVCGFRLKRQDNTLRRFLSWSYNNLISLLFGINVQDCDCALKVFRQAALRRVMPTSNNFFVNTEMLWRAQHSGLSMVEVAVRHRRRQLGHSKVSFADVPRTLTTLLPFWWSQVVLGQSRTVPKPPATNLQHTPATQIR